MASPDPAHPELADFHLGAPVYSSDGRHVGSLHRLVVDRESWVPHEIIVKENARFSGHLLAEAAGLITDDLIVPLDKITHVAHERVDLSLTSSEVRRLPPYLSYHYAPIEGRQLAIDMVSAGFGGGTPYPQTAEEADKPTGDIEIRQGENVMLGHTGHKLGEVRDVIFDEGDLVGVVIRPEGFFQKDVVVQVRFLERSDDAALFVRMSPEDLEQLKSFAQ
jgi:sporulation protein YlmC with PRC-barrel domain